MPPSVRLAGWRSLTPRRCRCQCRHVSDHAFRTPQQWKDGKKMEGSWNAETDSTTERVPVRMTRRVFSGIQPTGVPHLGNYLGALRQWKRLQDQSMNPNFSFDYRPEQFFCVVDLHALTSDTPPEEQLRLRKESFASLLAMGLVNNAQTTLFFQSDVWCHTELMWILSTIASTGYLSRMTQWKSKLNLPENANLENDEATARLKLGLFSYPVLQAADILLYRASMVPVGEDQLQHIEFARTLARSFNQRVRDNWKGNIFRVPWPILSPAKRIMSLKRPTQKMSKSDADPKSRILITDSSEEIYAKVKGAVTDSEPGITFDPEKRPGVSNLIEILRHVTNSDQTSYVIAKDLENHTMRAVKELIAREIVAALRGIRENFLEFTQPNNSLLYEQVEEGGRKARRKAARTLADVKRALGLQTLSLPWIETAADKEAEPNIDDFDPTHDEDLPAQYADSKKEAAQAIKEALAGLDGQFISELEPTPAAPASPTGASSSARAADGQPETRSHAR